MEPWSLHWIHCIHHKDSLHTYLLEQIGLGVVVGVVFLFKNLYPPGKTL